MTAAVLLLSAGLLPPDEPGWLAGETAHYTIRVQEGRASAPKTLRALERSMDRLFDQYALAFGVKDRAIPKATVRLYRDRAAYRAGGGPASTAAYYDRERKELAGFQDEEGGWFQALCHEGCHQFSDLAFPGYEEPGRVPMWFREGLADGFGASVVRGNKLYVFTLSGVASRRARAIKEAVKQGLHVPLSRLLTMGREPFKADAKLHYAQAWSLVHFLWNAPSAQSGKGVYRGVVARLINGFKKGGERDEVHRDAFRHKGKPIDLRRLEAEWLRYVKGLKVRG